MKCARVEDGRSLCALTAPVRIIGESTLAIYHSITCTNCLRRRLAEAEEQVRVLRGLLSDVERTS